MKGFSYGPADGTATYTEEISLSSLCRIPDEDFPRAVRWVLDNCLSMIGKPGASAVFDYCTLRLALIHFERTP